MRIARVPFNEVLEIVVLPNGVKISEAFHPEIAATMVECSAAVEPGWILNDQSFEPPPTPDLQLLKVDLKHQIDQTAEIIRLRYITPGSGQAMTYQQKMEEVRALAQDLEPDPVNYPLLSAEVGITAPTLAEVATVVLQAFQQWQIVGAAIEAARLGTKAAIDAAETTEDAEAAAAGAIWPTN